MMKITHILVVLLVVSCCSSVTLAQTPKSTGPSSPTVRPAAAFNAAPSDAHLGLRDTIPPGTTITMQNWHNYQRFMPDGMVALFQGSYFWQMPADVQIEVGPTTVHPLPRNYQAATEQYASQISIVPLPDGGLTLDGYRGGQPFPHPAEPHQGWKILANLWYRYLPHLLVDTHASGCYENRYANINCGADEIVYRQLSFNTDPGVAPTVSGAEGKYYTEWIMQTEPEQDKYHASLTIAYDDLVNPESVYVFLPSLRRYQPVSSAARCAPAAGSDTTPEDYRFGFDSNLTQLQANFLGERKILALMGDIDLPTGQFPEGYGMPLGWPTPSWGKWQVRDVDVISVSKLPSLQAGYCYGKRVMYIDQVWSTALWEDLYDAKLKPWKLFALFPHSVDVPGIGPVVTSGSQAEAVWDIQNNHATFFLDPGLSRPFYTNGNAPREYQDIPKYTTPGGLNEVMR